MPSSVPRPRFHALSPRSLWSAITLLAALMNCPRTAAEISDACRQDMEIILNSTKLAVLVPRIACDAVDYRPNFCSNDFQYQGSLVPYQDYCTDTLGMKIYQVDTWRVCQGDDYYNLNNAFCVGKRCRNETEIREVLEEEVFPLLDQSSADKYQLYCNTTFGVDGSQEKCDAQMEAMYNYPQLTGLFWKDNSLILCDPDGNRDCLNDFTFQFVYDAVEQVCELTGNRYQKIDHTWECVDIANGGPTFQYTFLNDPYCDGSSCSRTLPDYSDAFQEFNISCNLTEVAEKLSSAAPDFLAVVAAGSWSALLSVMVTFIF